MTLGWSNVLRECVLGVRHSSLMKSGVRASKGPGGGAGGGKLGTALARDHVESDKAPRVLSCLSPKSFIPLALLCLVHAYAECKFFHICGIIAKCQY